jgi:hypothetical protein
MLGWWYGAGWKQQIALVGTRASKVAKAFSGGAILRTLFSPWKQIVSGTDRDAAIGDKLRAMLDNIISRFVGFMVRSFTLIAAVFALAGTLLLVWRSYSSGQLFHLYPSFWLFSGADYERWGNVSSQ